MKLIERLTAELRSRLGFIGVDWADDDEDGDDDDEENGDEKNEDEDASSQKDQETLEDAQGGEGKEQKRKVRLLDYACGTGIMSRVSERAESLWFRWLL